jgi:hypothetical protein
MACGLVGENNVEEVDLDGSFGNVWNLLEAD